jgi:hypothetical protein
LNSALETLRSLSSTKEVCSPQTEKEFCSFKDFCRLFNGNETNEIVYRNAEGHYIANAEIGRIANAIGVCKSNLTKKMKKDADAKSALKMKRELFQQAKSLGITDDFNDVMVTLEEQFADIESRTFTLPNGTKSLTHAGPDQWIMKAEAAAKKKLPVEFTNQWIKYLETIGFDEYKDPKARKGEESFTKFSDNPFIDVGSFQERLAQGNPDFIKEVKTEQARAQEVFEDVKEKIVRVLTARKNGQNSDEIDNMLNRIQTIRLSDQLMMETCPNAAYATDSHQFSMCPEYLKAPRFTLVQLFAHELGHSIDPCGSLKPLYVDRKDPNNIHYSLEKNGQNFQEALPPILNYPFEGVLSCLQKKSSVWAQNASVQKGDSIARLETHLKSIDDQATLAELQSYKKSEKFRTEQRCHDMGNTNQLGESFADWISAETTALALQEIKDPKERKVRALESAIQSPNIYCPNLKQPFRQLALQLKDEYQCPGTVQSLEILVQKAMVDPHPFSSQRLEKIHFAHPIIRQAMGCSPDSGIEYCHEK